MLSIGGAGSSDVVIALFELIVESTFVAKESRCSARIKWRAGFFRIKFWLDDTIEKRSHDRP